MKYEVRFTPRFLKNIKALDKAAQVQIIREIEILKSNPHAGKPLRGDWKGVYSLRITTYRVLYQIIDNTVIILLAVGHRNHIDN